MKLTTAVVRSFKPPPGVSMRVLTDDGLRGLCVRVRASGSRVYSVLYGPATGRKWHRIGDASVMTLEQARAAAREVLARIALGANPLADKARARIEAENTFGALIEPFVAHKRKGRRESTVAEIERYLNSRAAPLHRLPVKEIDRATVATLLADVEKARGPGARNNTRNYLSSFFGWLQSEGFIDVNPVLATTKAVHRSRARLLSDDEAWVILTTLDGPQRVDADFRDVVRLLFLTGLRRNEVAGLLWEEVDLDRATIIVGADRMKNHREHLVPLCPAAVTILQERHARLDPGESRTTVFGRRDSGFSGFSKAKRELDAAVTGVNGGQPIEWVLHDVRRFVSTTLNERLSVEPHIAEVILAHYPKGISAVYNRSAYALEKRRALDKLADHLEALKTDKATGGKVVSLRSR
jgi:integrase